MTDPPAPFVETIPISERAPAAARAVVEEALSGNARLADAQLITSELVTNTVLHAGLDDGEPIRITIRCDEGRIEIRLRHRRSRHRRPGRPPPVRGGGFGLQIVDRLTNCWQSVQQRDTTETWFEL